MTEKGLTKPGAAVLGIALLVLAGIQSAEVLKPEEERALLLMALVWAGFLVFPRDYLRTRIAYVLGMVLLSATVAWAWWFTPVTASEQTAGQSLLSAFLPVTLFAGGIPLSYYCDSRYPKPQATYWALAVLLPWGGAFLLGAFFDYGPGVALGSAAFLILAIVVGRRQPREKAEPDALGDAGGGET